MLYEIKLNIKDYACLNIYTTSKEIKDKLVSAKSSIKRTIPITNVTATEIDNNNIQYFDSIVISNTKNKGMYYDIGCNVTVLNISENELRFPDLIYISLAMFSRILARQQKFLLHSSSLLYDSNNSFALVGDANAGKTSLAYQLMSRHNCKLISNDHSIIGVENGIAMILGGTKEIQMRLGAIELYFPELYKKIDVIYDDKWNKKIVVNDFIDTNLILGPEIDKAPLTNVFSISTTNSSESFVRKKDKIDEFLFLYESMSRILKGTYNYITGFDYPMPSMETEKTLNDLSELCKIIVEQCNVSEAKGSIKELPKVLLKKYEK